ncbi:MAG: nucleotidyl transferase AbiEii/AbiGii toxin family protein [Bdellovibrionales bacterium]|nr:nucleotidyl transferase AbiEii/AbiGii toxin family protein [Ramlibacter sp.]
MLRPDTQKLWDYLREQSALANFVLVGGTALSMHLEHRLSEDLDFMVPSARLPHTSINLLKRRAAAAGHRFVANDSPAGLLEFEDTGLDFLDYQQDYVVGGSVKVSLVAPDHEVLVLLRAGDPARPRVASLEEIFRLKCIVCANRSKTRDWLDMYVMLQRGLFQPLDIYRTFELAGVPSKYDIAMQRLCSGEPSVYDEGYESLLKAPPSVAAMRDFFVGARDKVEEEVARLKAVAKAHTKPHG